MSRPKRFRGMELTEEEATNLACKLFCYVDDFERLEARARRLLPLWRKWGLQALYNQGHQAACVGYAHAAMRRIEGGK